MSIYTGRGAGRGKCTAANGIGPFREPFLSDSVQEALKPFRRALKVVEM